jgi:hypothetical protein
MSKQTNKINKQIKNKQTKYHVWPVMHNFLNSYYKNKLEDSHFFLN